MCDASVGFYCKLLYGERAKYITAVSNQSWQGFFSEYVPYCV